MTRHVHRAYPLDPVAYDQIRREAAQLRRQARDLVAHSRLLIETVQQTQDANAWVLRRGPARLARKTVGAHRSVSRR